MQQLDSAALRESTTMDDRLKLGPFTDQWKGEFDSDKLFKFQERATLHLVAAGKIQPERNLMAVAKAWQLVLDCFSSAIPTGMPLSPWGWASTRFEEKEGQVYSFRDLFSDMTDFWCDPGYHTKCWKHLSDCTQGLSPAHIHGAKFKMLLSRLPCSELNDRRVFLGSRTQCQSAPSCARQARQLRS